jgi:ribosomal protein S12 methylthiotransferase accessory factor
VEYLVDNRVGIIEGLEEAPRQAGEPELFYFYAYSCDTSAFVRQRNSNVSGGGALDRDRALAKAVGEAVERYCSAIFDAEDFPLTTAASAPFPCIAPSEFALYSPLQYARSNFPFAPFSSDSLVRWTPSVNALTGEMCYVPAAMVYVPYYYDVEKDERPIAQPISTGLACHMSHAEAGVSAICEVLERDAFTITWQAKLSRGQIRLDSLSSRNDDLVQRLQRTGCKVTLLDLTMDFGIPTVLTALTSDSRELPALTLAASTHLDPEEATKKSLEEAGYTSIYARHLKSTLPPIVTTLDYENIVDQESHVRFYADHDHAALAAFLFASDIRIDFCHLPNLSTGDPKQDLNTLVRAVNNLGHKVLLSDLTTPDVRELGFWVLRAIVPGCHPLVLGHQIRATGGSRLWEVPQKLGYGGISRHSGDNPAPHPYP